jgi:outer membrane cobalamin receptor
MAIPAWPQETPKDLGNKSIEALMNIEVTSVSKKEQKLSRTAAAIFVITQEDIRRSGATNIPDLLRMVPGLDVAQVNSSTWAISSRGFNDQAANKLLVLIDGRTVYSPLFGGVFWDVQQVPLEIIDHIEVIRGPGAAVGGQMPLMASSISPPKKRRTLKEDLLAVAVAPMNEDSEPLNSVAKWEATPITAPS